MANGNRRHLTLFQIHNYYSYFHIFDLNMWFNLSFEEAITLMKNINKKNAIKEENTNGVTFSTTSPTPTSMTRSKNKENIWIYVISVHSITYRQVLNSHIWFNILIYWSKYMCFVKAPNVTFIIYQKSYDHCHVQVET